MHSTLTANSFIKKISSRPLFAENVFTIRAFFCKSSLTKQKLFLRATHPPKQCAAVTKCWLSINEAAQMS